MGLREPTFSSIILLQRYQTLLGCHCPKDFSLCLQGLLSLSPPYSLIAIKHLMTCEASVQYLQQHCTELVVHLNKLATSLAAA